MPFRTSILAYILFLFFWIIALELQGQDSSLLMEYNQHRLQIQSNGMILLGSWALGNIVLGTYGVTQTSGSVLAFHQMNIGWNLVNLAIAGWGYYSAVNSGAELSLLQSFAEQSHIEKILLFNAGLDIGYMMAGVFLLERSKRGGPQSDRWKGFGNSILLQGGFLFAFDLIMVGVHQKNWSQLVPKLQSLALPLHEPAWGLSWQISF
jgi:hypothetical protein